MFPVQEAADNVQKSNCLIHMSVTLLHACLDLGHWLYILVELTQELSGSDVEHRFVSDGLMLQSGVLGGRVVWRVGVFLRVFFREIVGRDIQLRVEGLLPAAWFHVQSARQPVPSTSLPRLGPGSLTLSIKNVMLDTVDSCFVLLGTHHQHQIRTHHQHQILVLTFALVCSLPPTN